MISRELLDLARELANSSQEPNQARLRRAVSTAYYALFHFLIAEATCNYTREELRAEFGRVFDHGKMKNAAVQSRARTQPLAASNETAAALSRVTTTFIELQVRRQLADYHLGQDWNRLDAIGLIDDVEIAFDAWSKIRESGEAQAFLIAMLGTRANA
jgi:hypothetical protein